MSEQRQQPVQGERRFTERASDDLDKRVLAAALQIQTQFEAMGKMIDQRVAAARDHGDARIDAITALTEERWASWRIRSLEHEAAVVALFQNKLDAMEKAREIQGREYERRLTDLNHEHERIAAIGATYVRGDIYDKDMQRLYTERQQQIQAAEAARVQTDATAATNRRSTTMALIGIGVTIVLSIALHFIPGGGAH